MSSKQVYVDAPPSNMTLFRNAATTYGKRTKGTAMKVREWLKVVAVEAALKELGFSTLKEWNNRDNGENR